MRPAITIAGPPGRLTLPLDEFAALAQYVASWPHTGPPAARKALNSVLRVRLRRCDRNGALLDVRAGRGGKQTVLYGLWVDFRPAPELQPWPTVGSVLRWANRGGFVWKGGFAGLRAGFGSIRGGSAACRPLKPDAPGP